MTHFRTLDIYELPKLSPVTKRRLRRGGEGIILIKCGVTIGAIVGVEVLLREFAHLRGDESFRLSQISQPTSPIHSANWLSEGSDLIWLTTNGRRTLALIHPATNGGCPFPRCEWLEVWHDFRRTAETLVRT